MTIYMYKQNIFQPTFHSSNCELVRRVAPGELRRALATPPPPPPPTPQKTPKKKFKNNQ